MLLSLISVPIRAQQFALTACAKPVSVLGSAAIGIMTSGLVPDSVTKNDSTGWEIRILPKNSNAVVFRDKGLRFIWSSPVVSIHLQPANVAGYNSVAFNDATIDVRFTQAGQTSTVTCASSSPSKHAKTVKGKDDAAIYAFGSVLAGVGTKPIYSLDLKAAPEWELGLGWFVGPLFTFTANSDVESPVDRSRVDPDSITGSLNIRHAFFLTNNSLGRFEMKLKPIGGEFTRKYPTSDLITKGAVRWTPFLFALDRVAADPEGETGHRAWLGLYPELGYELGKNLNTPSSLFNQPVNLTRWNALARVVPSATAEFYLLRPKLVEGDIYTLTFDATYQARVLFADEPYVLPVRLGSTVSKQVLLRTNTRHQVEANANWNFAKYMALSTKYRYGSLPPLFQFVDHQATVGITFKLGLP